MALANTAATEFGHSSLTPHHVLLGILREGSSTAIAVLGQLEVDLAELAHQTTAHLRGQTRIFTLAAQPTPQGAMSVINDAVAAANELHAAHVGCEHLLLAITRAQTTPASQLLARFSVTAKRVMAVMKSMTPATAAPETMPGAVEATAIGLARPEAARPMPGLMPAGRCALCDRVRGEDAGAVAIADLRLSRVFLGDNQGCAGWCVLLLKSHIEHLDVLPLDMQSALFGEVAAVARAIRAVFSTSGSDDRPPRINYECLGNQAAHIHWHVIPRHGDDPDPRNAVWGWPAERLRGAMTSEERAGLAMRIGAELREAK